MRKLTSLIDNNMRLAAQRRGFVLVKRKDKVRTPNVGNGYMIVDMFSGDIAAGKKYDLTPEEVRDFLNKH